MNKQKWLDLAETIDAMRAVPRLFMVLYLTAAGCILHWYMTLPDPTSQQTAFAGVIGATIGAVTKWYYQTGRDWQQK